MAHAISVSTLRFDHMSPTAAGMAAALHVLTALALWWATPYKSFEVPEQPIEVTMEEPPAPKAEKPPAKPEMPPPPQTAVKPPGAPTQPPPPPQTAPAKPAQVTKPNNIPLGIRPPSERAAEPQQATAQPEPKKQEPAPEPKKEEAAAEPKKEEAAPKPEPPAETKLPPIAEPPAPLTMQDFVRAAPPPPPMEIVRPQPRVQPTPPPAAPPPPTVQQQPAPQFAPSPLSHLAPPQQQQRAPAEAHATMVNPADNAARTRVVDEYLWQVGRKMSEHKTYSLSTNEQGSVILRLTIARDGRLLDASVARSSGSNNLDAASLALARGASPFAPLPPELTGNQVTFILPLNYKKFD